MTKSTPSALTAAALATTLTAGTALASDAAQPGSDYVVQFVRFESSLPRAEVLTAATERKPQFEAIPGLVQKFYLELESPNSYGGIYIWENKAAMAAFLKTDLFKSIPKAYGIASAPDVDIIPVLFPLR